MAHYSPARGARAAFNTNATLLTERAARQLVVSGLDWLQVSVGNSSSRTVSFVGTNYFEVYGTCLKRRTASGGERYWCCWSSSLR